jgi:hypothetical protein
MTKSEFLDWPCAKQVQLLISIRIHNKFCLLTTSALIGFQENIQQFIPQMETGLKGEFLFILMCLCGNHVFVYINIH